MQRHLISGGFLVLLAALFLNPVRPAAAAPYPGTESRLWPNGVVPYAYDGAVTASQQAVVEAAMAAWAATASIQFVPHTDEEDYLFVEQGTYGPAYPPPVGYRPSSGAHALYLNGWYQDPDAALTCTNVYGMVHEVGHALGLAHTHQRTDRDQYVSVDTNRLAGDVGPADWNILTDTRAWPPEELDVDSIMAYPLCTGAASGGDCWDDIPNEAPIVLLEPYATAWSGLMVPPDTWTDQCPYQRFVGQRNHVSAYDAYLMSFLYPESGWRFVDQDANGADAGTFYDPYTTFVVGYQDVPANGTLWLDSGSYLVLGTLSQPMTLQAPLGGVVLGQ